jgi:hypothetical protein
MRVTLARIPQHGMLSACAKRACAVATSPPCSSRNAVRTIIWIVVVVIAAASLIAAIAWVARKKRTEHHRVQAGDIREKAVEQSHKVGQREALADETAAKARAAQAEAEAMSAPAAGLQHDARRRGYLPQRGRPPIRARRQDRSGLGRQRHGARRFRNPRCP